MVRDVFRLAKQNAPSIIFVDEVGAGGRGGRCCAGAPSGECPPVSSLWTRWVLAGGQRRDGQLLSAGPSAARDRNPPAFRRPATCLPACPIARPPLLGARAAQVDAIATARFDAQTGADRCAPPLVDSLGGKAGLGLGLGLRVELLGLPPPHLLWTGCPPPLLPSLATHCC